MSLTVTPYNKAYYQKAEDELNNADNSEERSVTVDDSEDGQYPFRVTTRARFP